MKKLLSLIICAFIISAVQAQVDTAVVITQAQAETAKKPKKVYNLSNRANDHFMLQLGYLSWLGMPDSIDTKGFRRSINMYFMFDFPFKSAQEFSAAIGLGVGSDNMILEDYANLKGTTNNLQFQSNYMNVEGAKFKKTSLKTIYLEAPIELRWVQNPENTNKSFKAALGVKVGTMIKASTRSKGLTGGGFNYAADYTLKESSKKYFNTIRAAATARVGYGPLSLFASYQLTPLLKDGVGPVVRPLTVGLTLSGL